MWATWPRSTEVRYANITVLSAQVSPLSAVAKEGSMASLEHGQKTCVFPLKLETFEESPSTPQNASENRTQSQRFLFQMKVETLQQVKSGPSLPSWTWPSWSWFLNVALVWLLVCWS